MNGIFVVTEYRGNLIRKIVCNKDIRWFIGNNCAVTYDDLTATMTAIDVNLPPEEETSAESSSTEASAFFVSR